MAHTVASIAGRVLVVEKETKLQDERITAVEATGSAVLQSMAHVSATMDARLGNGLTDKIANQVTATVALALATDSASRDKKAEELGKRKDRTRAWFATAASVAAAFLGYMAFFRGG